MVQAIVDLNKKTNYIVNLIKAKYSLKDKSEAINKMAEEYSEEVLDFELRPEYIERLKKLQREPTVKVKDIDKYFDSL
jgi:Mg2+ and Co2+ transporter CorA